MKNRLSAIWRLIWANEFYLLTPWGVNGQWFEQKEGQTTEIIRNLNRKSKGILDDLERQP